MDSFTVVLQGKYEWAGQQQQGDCSLRILRANLAYDDGLWECQVTRTQSWEQTCRRFFIKLYLTNNCQRMRWWFVK